jgi:acetyltransferase-like isoleucine patch superfamily enzyme
MLKLWLRRFIGIYRNLKDGNRIDFAEVALATTVGHHVHVCARTSIDRYCTIGSYTFVGFNCTITRATIGRYTSIANNVTIGPGEHRLDRISTSQQFAPLGFEELTSAPVVIGNDVWIGVDSIVRRGVTIGHGAVIGANSFVRDDVPPFAIVAGSPARVVGYRFTAAQRDRITTSQWWELEREAADQAIAQLVREFQDEENTAAASTEI